MLSIAPLGSSGSRPAELKGADALKVPLWFLISHRSELATLEHDAAPLAP